jgi:hypothetical protein
VRALKSDNHSPVIYAVAGVVLLLFVLLITFWDNGYQKHLARVGPVTAAELEDEYDYDEDGERVLVARPEPRFPVPPLDLPHYHGLGSAVPPDTSAISGSVQDDTADATKEVSGA